MKFLSFITLSLLVTTSFNRVAQADDGYQPVPVSEPSLRILGSGLADEETLETIAVACVGEPKPGFFDRECDQLRFVYGDANRNYFYVSDILKIQQKSNPRRIQRETRSTLNDYVQARVPQGQKNLLSVVKNGLGLGLGITFLASAASGGSFILVVGAATGAYSIYYTLGGRDLGNLLTSDLYSATPVTLTQNNGWNWSSAPKTVRHKKFQKFAKALIGS